MSKWQTGAGRRRTMGDEVPPEPETGDGPSGSGPSCASRRMPKAAGQGRTGQCGTDDRQRTPDKRQP
ncbi:hypothetical protein C8Q78DRAFT_83266 [Trametes maxima]|nr:hypothetical protein C8Q78DRAFT_83266 [Trametes maxima]